MILSNWGLIYKLAVPVLDTQTMYGNLGVPHKYIVRHTSLLFTVGTSPSTSEDVFGISSAIFLVLRKPMLLQSDRAITIVMTVVYLHNFLRRNHSSSNLYTPPGTFDREDDDGEFVQGTWRAENNDDMQSL
ncbi:hypothetical protein PR048_011057 [Dryococelus australis]|uniref:Uncharacterized protein n=1 Tax=Dryococelus australis TaxID=614101 RepID=A0ABQ9HKK0_9NEOP|nr:hypothetical protein PR048_011057 [Dryococelus australis]